MVEFDTHIGKLDYLMGVNYIYVPEKILKSIGGLKCGRLVCTVNDTMRFQCGLLSLSKGDAYITFNKARVKELKLKIGDQIKVKLEKDKSEFGFDLCEELKILFEQDPDGLERFRKLKPGMQRQIIYFTGNAKSSQVRISRAINMFTKLKEIPEGKETFRYLFGKENQ